MRFMINTILLVAMLAEALTAQVLNPVSWRVSSDSIGNGRYSINFTATIEPGWYIYSTDLPPGGPLPTSFNFDDSKDYIAHGEVMPHGELKQIFDQVFKMQVGYYANTASFTQEIELLVGVTHATASGTIVHQACFEDKCIFVQEDFSIPVGTPTAIATNTEPEAGLPNGAGARQGLLVFLLIAFGAGLAGLLTPCVFPMIPLTVSFFMGKQGSRLTSILNALVFGASIVAIYTAIGLLVSLTSLGAGFANELVSHWLPNTIFFLLFMAFAASFFGVFEITLPSSLATRTDGRAGRGGFIGTFFMALTLVIVSLSCVGPIVGALLVEAATVAGLKPALGMFAFSLAFAIPFTLFAIFPSWLSKLPKSGGWLNSVKVVLGFIILAFGLKFLDTISRAYHLNFLSREVFIAIWIAIAILLGLYLLGKIRFKLDSPIESIGFFRMLLALSSFAFAIYLLPGMVGAPLRPLSGLIPPPKAVGLTTYQPVAPAESPHTTLCDEPRYADILSLPHGLQGYFHYEQALACAREQNKPLFIDFVGHACANCKVMEQRVWSDPRVLQRLRDNYVIVALYVDDKTPLPREEWFTSTLDGKVKNTLGRRNADLQVSKFGSNSQPSYVLIDGNEQLLAPPYGYNLNVDDFIEFLDGGIRAFNRTQPKGVTGLEPKFDGVVVIE